MKKWLPYIIGITVLVLLCILMFTNKSGIGRRFDERITLNQRDKIPYGMSVAKGLLPSVFPEADIYYDDRLPGNWDSIYNLESNQAVILVCKEFNADDEELTRLQRFVGNGNYVFIITRTLSYEATKYFDIKSVNSFQQYFGNEEDSLSIKLNKSVFGTDSAFSYPGQRFESWINNSGSKQMVTLGTDDSGNANFIALKKDSGGLFIHLAPLAFSNYFILHKSNKTYYEKALSVIPSRVTKVLWNDYYLSKPSYSDDNSGSREPNWLSVLAKHWQFLWGLLVLLFLLLLHIILNMRRKERLLVKWEKPKNESLDFVKTVGRLYYDRKDHGNLASKMAGHFLEHIRAVYKLPTHTLDDAFVKSLYYKSGYDEQKLKQIVSFSSFVLKEHAITEMQLTDFYNNLELFYQNT